MVQFYFKAFGSSIFFLAFPFLVVVSLDEEGMGLEVTPTKEREAEFLLPAFSFSLKIQ